ncbi:MAG: hypothetical protein VKO21_08565 [Candidatus Sericytochromatia bacterium]|nr:hypothetical protein [Candidatus Sericytochromatia bacterium]
MTEMDELKQSAEKLAQTTRESAERIAEAARDTAGVGVRVLRETVHGLIKDETTVAKMKEMEEAFDRQVAEATRQIEDGARNLMSFWQQAVKSASGEPTAQEPVTRIEVEGQAEAKEEVKAE